MKLSDRFIRANADLCDFRHPVNAPYLRRAFTLDFVPQVAEITICGLGFYELTVNGVNVTKGPLAPYINNTDDVCYYDNYNILPYLRQGENVIGVLLGNGFRNPFGGFVWDFEKSTQRGPVCVALCLEAKNATRRLSIECDEQFLTHPSPILFDDLRMGCQYDARLEIEGWDLPGFDASGWTPAEPSPTPKGIARLCDTDPIVVTNEITPVSVNYYDELAFAHTNNSPKAEPLPETVRPCVHVVDFGINSAGVSRLHLRNAKPGQRIVIRHAEYFAGGNFDVKTTVFDGTPDRMAKYYEYGQTDVYYCRGGDEVFTPKFKYDGFRYAYVEGVEPDQWQDDTLIMLVMNSDLTKRADFHCSDERLNKLQLLTQRSDLANFYYFPTDCPHREKNGWTGDASLSAEQMLLNFTAARSMKEWLFNIRLAQREDGALPGIVPTGGWGFAWGNGPAWDAVSVNLPYQIFRFEGDTEVIFDNAVMIDRYLHYAETKRDEKGLVAYGLGDWLDPFKHERGRIASPLEFTDSAQIYDISKKAAFLFDVIGLDAQRDYAAWLSGEMRASIRAHLLDRETMTMAGNCQTSQAMALCMGIFEEEELSAARQTLLDIIHREGDVTACGVQGMRYIFHALADMGEIDLAYQLLVCEKRTCYGHWLANGAESLWESFADAKGKYVDSRNHHFLGDISSFFIQEIAGLRPNPHLASPDEFEIRPIMPTALDHASAYADTRRGRLSCTWRRLDGKISFSITVPAEMSGKLIFDGRVIELGAGTHSIEFR